MSVERRTIIEKAEGIEDSRNVNSMKRIQRTREMRSMDGLIQITFHMGEELWEEFEFIDDRLG
jgi:hypothetical protein